jgi:preprotein translocase subunit SecG
MVEKRVRFSLPAPKENSVSSFQVASPDSPEDYIALKRGYRSFRLDQSDSQFIWRDSQVVRQRSAKPLFAGSIPAHASTLNQTLMLPLQIAQVVVTILLAATILLQQRGTGLGDAFGAGSEVFTSRRGAEKILFYLSIIFGISFVILAVLQLVLAK